MTPAIYHKTVALGALPRFHDYHVPSSTGEEGLFLLKNPVRGVFAECSYRETAGSAGCRQIVRSTGTLFGRNTQS
jgi:hypothetical protein